jgi:SAM-dependent methyltransferase
MINASKANFDDIYNEADPRGYFSALGALDYMIPDLAKPVIDQLLSARHAGRASKLSVLDVGCSYGINAALHRYPLTFGTLRRRDTRGALNVLSADALRRLDHHYYASWPDSGVAQFIGLDSSASAIEYARSVELIESGVVANLEQTELTPEQAHSLRDVDVILSTGCIGYVTEKTYRTVLQSMTRAPWIISFVLRMFPFEPLARVLADYGLVTERLAGATFAQRRFRDAAEFEHTLSVLAKRGISTNGMETQGLLHAELFLSRPAADVRAAPLAELVTICSGTQRPVGVRYVMVEHEAGQRIVLES